MHLTAGRLESDIRISSDIAYNAYPFSTQNNEEIPTTGGHLHDIVETQLDNGLTLATITDHLSMPVDVVKAHNALDIAVQKGYGWAEKSLSVEETTVKLKPIITGLPAKTS